MRGGKFLNNFRMAELHAKEAPDRVWELETYGALFDRTKDGKICQRNFGGHEYPRLAHVGDRTGLELIRTLQQKIVSLQQEDFRATRRLRGPASRSSPSARSPSCCSDGDGGSPARSATTASPASSCLFDAPAVILATGGVGKSYKVTSNSWEYTGDGHALALRAGATLINMEFLQFHPTGMVWPPSVQGHPGHRVGPRRRRRPEELRGQAVHVRLRAGRVPQAVRGDRGRGRPLVHRPGQQPAPAGAAPPRRGRPRDQLRGQGRPGYPGRRRLPRHRVAGCRPRSSSSGCRRCTTSSRSWPTSTSPSEPMEVGPTCHYVMGGVEVDPDTAAARPCPGLFAAGEVSGGMHGSNRLGGNSLSDLLVFGKRAGEYAAALRRRARRAPAAGRRRRRRRRGCETALAPLSRGRAARTRTRSSTTCRQSMHDLVGIIRRKATSWRRRSSGWPTCAAGSAKVSATGGRSSTRAGTSRSTCATC